VFPTRKKNLHNIVLRPTATAPFLIIKRFSYNATGLSPVLKKPHPTTKGQGKTKSGTEQEQPWIVQGSKKNNKQHQQTTKTTTNNSLGLIPPQSPPWVPLSLWQNESVISTKN
jgi:hypothetical protein